MKEAHKELLRVFITAPTGFGIVAAFSSRLEVGPLMTQLVQHYYRISRAFWEDLVPSLFRFEVNVPHSQLSFVCLLLVSIASNTFIWRSTGESKNRAFWSFLSFLSVIIFSIAFGIEAEILVDLNSIKGKNNIGAALMLPFWVVFIIIVFADNYRENINRNRTPWDKENIKVAIYVAALTVVYMMVFSGNRVSEIPVFSFFAVCTAVAGSIIVALMGLKAPAYILISAVGVFFFGWIAEGVLPTIADWINCATASDSGCLGAPPD